MVGLVRSLGLRRFDRRFAKIGDRTGNFLVDRRNAILRRAYSSVFLAAIAPTATPAAPAAAPTVAIAVIGPGGAGLLSLLVADVGLGIAAGQPVHRHAPVVGSGQVGR